MGFPWDCPSPMDLQRSNFNQKVGIIDVFIKLLWNVMLRVSSNRIGSGVDIWISEVLTHFSSHCSYNSILLSIVFADSDWTEAESANNLTPS